MNLFNNKSEKEQKRYIHNLVKGDHVVRWTRMVVYPIQVHGIVLSASDDVVTIVDFGLTASSSTNVPASDEKNSLGNGDREGNQNAKIEVAQVHTNNQHEKEGGDNNANNSNNTYEDMSLEAMMNHEDKAIMEKCEAHREEMMGPDRINVLVLTEEKDIKQWKKVEYAVETKKKGKFKWFWEKDDKKKDKEKQHDNEPEEEKVLELEYESPEDDTVITKSVSPPKEQKSPQSKQNSIQKEKEIPEALLTKSDPTTIVLSRVRYLITKPHVLPPHNIFYSNSECIAVWCKTGVWSTFQAVVYLNSTAAGNFKTVVTAAAAVGSSTVTTTVPASGIAGWFGMTTTTTVSLVSVQPWLIPVIAGWSLIAVGTPVIFLKKCHNHWRDITTMLNDKFWSELDVDVYVEAIKSWSGLE